jgi:acyl-CoA synthetase (NDP forming)
MIGALLSRGAVRGIGFSKMVSVGAEMDLSIGELCGATLDDPDVTGYLLFLETIRHSADLRAFAAGAAERGKPVLSYKLGKSEMAAQLAASHTGALAGEDDVASAFLADAGIVRVHTLEGLLEGAPLVARTPTRTPGRRPAVGVVTTTGGGAAMVVDQLGVHGTQVVPPSEETLRRMAAAGAFVEPGLITDLTLAGTRPETMRAALGVLAVAPEFDLIVAVAGSSARHSPELVVEPIVEVATRSGTHPIATFLVPDAPEALEMLYAAGVPSFRTPEACADAIAASLNRDAPRASLVPTAPLSPSVLIDEADSYAVLRSAGIPVAPFAVLHITAAPLVLPDGLSFPVAVKALSDQLAHKSDVGGVRLDVGSDAELDAAARTIRAEVLAGAGTPVDRVLVQQMTRAVGEVLLGYRIDAEMGPLVLVAAGGTRAEVYADRSIRMAPVDRDTAKDMLDEVAAMEIFRGFRGAEVGDLAAVVEAVVGLSELCLRGDVVEAEINPLMVFAEGAGVVAVDAAVRVRSGGMTVGTAKREDAQIHV